VSGIDCKPSVIYFKIGDVLQQMPLTVTVAPPSEVTFPPLVTVVVVMLVAAVIVTVGRIGFSIVVVNVT
jgi:hypothetical protein